jgi:hypothetical protein
MTEYAKGCTDNYYFGNEYGLLATIRPEDMCSPNDVHEALDMAVDSGGLDCQKLAENDCDAPEDSYLTAGNESHRIQTNGYLWAQLPNDEKIYTL